MQDIVCISIGSIVLFVMLFIMWQTNKNSQKIKAPQLPIRDFYQRFVLERDNHICSLCQRAADGISSISGMPYETILLHNTGMYQMGNEWKAGFYNTTREKFEAEIVPDLISICADCKSKHERAYTTWTYQLALERDNYTCKICGRRATDVVDLVKSEWRPMALLDKTLIGNPRDLDRCICVCERCRLQNVSPTGFEEIIESSFTRKGYSVTRVGGTGDGGVDLICVSPTHQEIIVQCKRYKGSVGAPVLRDFFGALVHSKADLGYVITTGHFTDSAVEFAKDKQIILVDGATITKFLAS